MCCTTFILVRSQGLETWARWLRVSCSTNWAKSAGKRIRLRKCSRKPHRHKRESRHLPIFAGRLQPTIFGTTELNFCVRNGNRWNLCVIGTGQICFKPGLHIFSFTWGMHPQNWISNCFLSKQSIWSRWGQALDLLVHASWVRHRTYTLCLSTL